MPWAGHFEGGLGGFGAAVVVFVEAADDGLGFVFEEEDFVDDGDDVLKLKLGKG